MTQNDGNKCRHISVFLNALWPKGVLVGEEARRYEVGERKSRRQALCVLRPADTSETSSVVAYCVNNGLTIIHQGANIGLVAGATPSRCGTDVVLSVERP